jgi:SAM-dependent methyltransferase
MWLIRIMRPFGPLLRFAISLAILFYALRQVRKPSRWGGRFFLWIMNMSHSGLTDWGLTHVRIDNDFTILDVGCGGGRTIQKLALLAKEGKVYGIDYAKGSVDASRGKNAQLIEEGRAEIQEASVSQLPSPANKFDLVTAVETQYYWPDVVNDMQEILRVLKPGGTLLVIAESYRKGTQGKHFQPVMKMFPFKRLSVDDHRELFLAAGYSEVRIFEEPSKGWVCGLGKKTVTVSHRK